MMFGNYYLMLDFLYYVDLNVISMLLVSNGLLFYFGSASENVKLIGGMLTRKIVNSLRSL